MMEKIYENKTNSRKNMTTRRYATVGITLAVALIAIASLLAISVSKNSYALDEVTTLPEKVKTNNPNLSTDQITGETATFKIVAYKDVYSDAKLFCLESKVPYAKGIEMTKGAQITDKGLIYLASKLEKLTVSTSDFSGITKAQASAIDTWVKQNAYWVYLAEINDPNSSPAYAQTIPDVKTETSLTIGTSGVDYFPEDNTVSFFDKYGITAMIETAKTYHSSANPILNVAVTKANDTWTKKDGTYKSAKISVAFSGAQGFEGLVEAPTTYSLSLGGAPSGTKVYGVNKTTNKEVDLTSNLKDLDINTYTDFYIVVPESSVQKNTNYSMALSASGLFKQYSGYYYEGKDDQGKDGQRVTTIALINQPKDGHADLNLTVTEDTALDVSQSIYFIGLIVLLSGLGILYANVKKQKEY